MSQSVLTVGERRFLLADLPPQAHRQCQHIEFCEQHIARLQRELALLQQIRAEALQALPALLPADADSEPDVGDVSPQKRRRYWPSAPACKPRRA